MSHSHLNDVSQAIADKARTNHPIKLGIVAPDGRDGMMLHCEAICQFQCSVHL
jgi:hypothetical protein